MRLDRFRGRLVVVVVVVVAVGRCRGLRVRCGLLLPLLLAVVTAIVECHVLQWKESRFVPLRFRNKGHIILRNHSRDRNRIRIHCNRHIRRRRRIRIHNRKYIPRWQVNIPPSRVRVGTRTRIPSRFNRFRIIITTISSSSSNNQSKCSRGYINISSMEAGTNIRMGMLLDLRLGSRTLRIGLSVNDYLLLPIRLSRNSWRWIHRVYTHCRHSINLTISSSDRKR
jgi:hypothetical protein